MSSSIPTTTTTSYWCHSCTRIIPASPEQLPSCPSCHAAFLEPIHSVDRRRSRQPPYNPIIVLRGSPADVESPPSNDNANSFELFYADNAGTGLRPLPRSVSNFVMGAGFDQLLDQLSRIENTPIGGGENAPASKSAVESLPTVNAVADCCCAVCAEELEVGEEVLEMPCKHLFHKDCILQWLSSRNTCPVCRHEMPTDLGGRGFLLGGEGLTIWRLPGGGFAVGRFREVAANYGEIDRSLSSGGMRRRVLWSSGGRRLRERRGVGRILDNFFSMFRCFSASSLSSASMRFPSVSNEAVS